MLLSFLLSILLPATSSTELSTNIQRADSSYAIPADSVITTNKIYRVRDIMIAGNKVTKKRIILRELSFTIGDLIQEKEVPERIKKSRQQLINTGLFNYVSINLIPDTLNFITVSIRVYERWYIWPIPIFEIADRNFNQWWLTKDFSRTNYGMYFSRYNFRGRNETIKINAQHGYTRKYDISYNVPWLNRKQSFGGTFFAGFSQRRELGYETQDNILQFFSYNNRFMYRHLRGGLSINFRGAIHVTRSFQISYTDIVIDDSISTQALNPDYFLDGKKQQQALNLKYTFISDHRNYRAYPLSGHYIKLELQKNGLGIFNDIDLFNIRFSANRYFELSQKKYFAIGAKTKISNPSRQPYLNNRALGYNDLVRGYEYYVIEGQHSFLLQSVYKYSLFANKEFHIGFLPINQFNTIPFSIYFNVFADAGYVRNRFADPSNTFANTLLTGGGVGIDFVTFYDKIIRFEYSINRPGRTDLYLHFKYPF